MRKSARLSTQNILKKWFKKKFQIKNENEIIAEFMKKSLRTSTLQQYLRIEKLYEAILTEEETPYPINANKISRFVIGLTDCHIKSLTIRKYVSAIKTLNILNGHPELSGSDVSRVSRCLKSVRKLKPGNITKKASILTSENLEKLFSFKSATNVPDITLVIIAVGVCLGLRLGEILNLSSSDYLWIKKGNRFGVKLVLKKTKTNEDSVFRYILCNCNDSKEAGTVCAAHLMKSHIDKMRPKNQNPFKIFPVKSNDFIKNFRKILKQTLNFPPWYAESFSGHSLRRSTANILTRKGFKDKSIMSLCRWKSHKSFLGYID
jgi:integrase